MIYSDEDEDAELMMMVDVADIDDKEEEDYRDDYYDLCRGCDDT
jgi:hypothetical protein